MKQNSKCTKCGNCDTLTVFQNLKYISFKGTKNQTFEYSNEDRVLRPKKLYEIISHKMLERYKRAKYLQLIL